MNKIEQKHLEVINYNFPAANPLERQGNRLAATSCVEITKEYAMEFAEWIIKEKLMLGASKKYEGKTPHELWNIFLNDLNEKP